ALRRALRQEGAAEAPALGSAASFARVSAEGWAQLGQSRRRGAEEQHGGVEAGEGRHGQWARPREAERSVQLVAMLWLGIPNARSTQAPDPATSSHWVSGSSTQMLSLSANGPGPMSRARTAA